MEDRNENALRRLERLRLMLTATAFVLGLVVILLLIFVL
jgi:hypothetical protein